VGRVDGGRGKARGGGGCRPSQFGQIEGVECRQEAGEPLGKLGRC
jgi:hypothetical protein